MYKITQLLFLLVFCYFELLCYSEHINHPRRAGLNILALEVSHILCVPLGWWCMTQVLMTLEF